MYWRTASGREVDFVVEVGRRIIGIEVKATRWPSWSDAEVLSQFVKEQGDHAAGVLLHGGDEVTWMSERVLAVPWWKVI
ncbi:MAG: DUF4143 domain-containing protein [Gemmatimonadetes bacterium]|nr:DUF4143 domain-containing protein [Gemmatimonadota bacterium]